MARNRTDRQEEIDDSGELIQQDGKWYKRVSMEQAWSIRKDMQLYLRHGMNSGIYGIASPDVHRAMAPDTVPIPWAWKDPNYEWFVEVDDPNKDEYVPKHPSTNSATLSNEVATTRCGLG